MQKKSIGLILDKDEKRTEQKPHHTSSYEIN